MSSPIKIDYPQEWVNGKCDKYDYLIAASSGVIAGIIDIFFVGIPKESVLGGLADNQVDNLVKKFASFNGWKPRKGNEDNVASAIGFLEKNFKVNYDQRYSSDVNDIFKMSTTNHHFKSLGHSPDIVGLFFSILDQFQGKASFISDGSLIRIDTTNSNFRLIGSNLVSKIGAGFCNWLGHIMSDISGSSGGRGGTGRGSGIPIPFTNLFQLCDFGELQVGKHRQTLAMVMTKVFQEGYDFRFGLAMATPVIINELIIRIMWTIKKHFYESKPWSECIPNHKHGDLRIMLIVGNGALCLVDGLDATIRSGGNAVAFILRLNLIAWVRFILLVLKEIKIRYGKNILRLITQFIDDISTILPPSEMKNISEYYNRMEAFEYEQSLLLKEYIEEIDREHEKLLIAIKNTELNELTSYEQTLNSVDVARICGVNEEEIIKDRSELDDFFIN